MKTTRAGFTATTLAALALAACNDSGLAPEQQGSNGAAFIEGAYGGFLSGVHTDYYRLLLTDTDLWLAYGISSPRGFQATGFFHASGTIGNSTYTGSSAIEYFNESPAGTGTVSAVNDAAGQPPLLKGNFVIAGNTSDFSAGPESTSPVAAKREP